MSTGNQYDIMISYHTHDDDLQKFLTEKFEKLGLKVFHAPPTDVSKRVEAVINCSVFVLVLSEYSAQETLCNDETSLAYISNRPIFPVATDEYPNIAKHLDFSLKLTLAKINWVFFKSPDEYEKSFEALSGSISLEIKKTSDFKGDKSINRQTSLRNEYNFTSGNKKLEAADYEESDFWDRNFPGQNAVPFDDIWNCFLKECKTDLDSQFDSQQLQWLRNLLFKEAFSRSKVVPKHVFMEFRGLSTSNTTSTPSDPGNNVPLKSFYARVIEYATGNLAMKEVFNMNSIVRMDAIRNLASFKTAAVVSSLLDLLEDPDANLRAVAAISLSKVGDGNQEVYEALIRTTEDPDRLAREAAILSLGKMKCEQAIPRILQIWRNDPIAPVRAAAEIALQQMEVPATKVARRMVDLISNEITSLKQQAK